MLEREELCFDSLARKRANKLMWSMEHNNSKARWGAVVFPVCFCIMADYSCHYL